MRYRWLLFLFFAGVISSFQVLFNTVSVISFFIWLVPQVAVVIYVIRKLGWSISKRTGWYWGMALLPVAIRLVFISPDRMHLDEVVTGYFSAHYNLFTDNSFAGVPSDKGQWVSQFPAHFFILQQLFFKVSGASLYAIHVSVLPYIFLTGLSVYGIGKELWPRIAWVAVVIYSFWAPALYLDTLGLHFAASTAVFSLFMWLTLRVWRRPSLDGSILLGVCAAWNYLFYVSSYIALPLLLLAAALTLVGRHTLAAKHFIMSGIIALMILAPFLTYAITVDNYFTSRTRQVQVFQGEWSQYKDASLLSPQFGKILGRQLLSNAEALVVDGKSGHGGYMFGQRALFDPLALVLVVLGTFGFVWLIVKKRDGRYALILLAVAAGFLLMMLSILPPALHRMSVVFPLLSLIMAFPLIGMSRFKRARLVLPVVLGIFLLMNVARFQDMAKPELMKEGLTITRRFMPEMIKRKVYIASFPGFYLEKLIDIEATHAINIQTGYHAAMLEQFNSTEPYLYIYIFPIEFDFAFITADPKGKIVYRSNDFGIFMN